MNSPNLLMENEEAMARKSEIEMQNVFTQYDKNTEEGKYYGHGFKTFSGSYRSEYNLCMEDKDREGAKEQMDFRVDTWHEIIEFSMGSGIEDLLHEWESFQTHLDTLELLYEHAKLFKVCPTKKQIKDMLKQLDDQSPTWDDDTPELLLRRLLEEQTKIQP